MAKTNEIKNPVMTIATLLTIERIRKPILIETRRLYTQLAAFADMRNDVQTEQLERILKVLDSVQDAFAEMEAAHDSVALAANGPRGWTSVEA